MTTLHILFVPALPDALTRLWSPGDSLLLAGAAVTLALRTDIVLPQPCLALQDAVAARGLAARWPSAVTQVDDAAWVALVASHTRSLSWS